MNPLHLDAAQRRAAGRTRPRVRELPRALPQGAADVRTRRARRAVPHVPRLDGAALRGAGPTSSSARASACRSPKRSAGTCRVSSARPSGTRCSPRTGWCRRSRRTLADLGIDLKSQENVTLDLDERPNKSPRAFCAPIEVPDRVVLVIQPIGGPDDWRALFHEGGHTEHFAHTSRDLSMEEKRLGDNAVTEGWAMLLQHLTDEPAWLTRRLDFPRPERVRDRRRDRAPLLRAPLRGEDPVRDRVPRRRGRDDDARPLRGAALATR